MGINNNKAFSFCEKQSMNDRWICFYDGALLCTVLYPGTLSFFSSQGWKNRILCLKIWCTVHTVGYVNYSKHTRAAPIFLVVEILHDVYVIDFYSDRNTGAQGNKCTPDLTLKRARRNEEVVMFWNFCDVCEKKMGEKHKTSNVFIIYLSTT